MSATERAALVTVLLWKASAVDGTGTVRPRARWAADPARG